MKKYIKLLRVKHYFKNGLVFLPLLFSGQLFDGDLLLKAVLGFFSFSFMSSTIYIVNDIMDLNNDRNHPTKRFRPIASGEISIKSACIISVIFLIISMLFNYFAFHSSYMEWFLLLLYFAINIGYSLGLKNKPIIDITILAFGFLIRVFYGSAVTNISISSWLYLTIIAMAFYLGLGKRRNEMDKKSDSTTRTVLKYYNREFLDKNMYMCLALTIVFYSLWSVAPVTLERLGSDNLVWTVPLVILICMKYSLTIEGNSDGDPIEVLFKDKLLLLLCVIFGLVVTGIIYI